MDNGNINLSKTFPFFRLTFLCPDSVTNSDHSKKRRVVVGIYTEGLLRTKSYWPFLYSFKIAL